MAGSRLCTAVVLGLFGTRLGAQAPLKSTLQGVYTEMQADKGRDVYGAMCASCHTLASHTGTPFKQTWVGRLLSELFDFIRETMPDGQPGTLTPDETTVVVAYLLKLNGFPAGMDSLPSDSGLKAIRFDTAAPPQQHLPFLR